MQPGQDDGGPATLAQRLASGPMNPGEAVALMDELCTVVGEGHRDGVVVGALSPAAIVLEGARARLQTAGTAADASFLSPQQLEGKPADERADVFALGVIGYVALTGADPFGGPADDSAARLAAIGKGPADPLIHAPKLNGRIRQVLLVALARNLTERFADALTMRAALRGDSQVALETPTLRWAVPEGIPEGDTGAADEYAAGDEATWEDPDAGGELAP
jgi:serine/threonine-protein kinase